MTTNPSAGREHDLAVVTGAASGIGLATVELLIERRYGVVGVDLADMPGPLANQQQLSWVAGDVAAEETWRRVGDAVHLRDPHGAAAAFIACAGTLVSAPMLDIPIEDWQRVFDVNVYGTLRGLRTLVPAMRAKGRGAVAVVCSVNSVIVEDTLSAYCASKAALLQLVRSAALEYAADGLSVNAVLPGIVDTPLFRRFVDVTEDPPAVVRSLAQRVPTGKLITPREIAEILCFLVSERATALSGAAILADGGITTAYNFNVTTRSSAATAVPLAQEPENV
jgi:NAD(P)-dependent dehydrogenase (short-subunit alcohol dehydrogenase family)